MAFRIDDEVNEARARELERFLRLAFDGKAAVLGRRLGYKDGSFVGQMLRREKAVTEVTWAKVCALHEVKPLINASTPVFGLVSHLTSRMSAAEALRNIAEADDPTGVPGAYPRHLLNEAPKALDHRVSYRPDTFPVLTREQVMERADELWGEFWIDLWDEAVGGELPKGTRTLWDADLAGSPEVGDFVLIKTADGRVHVRVYAESLAAGWQGKALHPDYEPIPAGEGVRVLAVFVSAKVRRSQLRR